MPVKRKPWSVLSGNKLNMNIVGLLEVILITIYRYRTRPQTFRAGNALELSFDERNVNMHKQMKNALLVGIIILLLAACGGFETAPAPTAAPAIPVTETPASIPTAAPSDGSAPESFRQYIGLNYPPFLPAGFSQGFSMLIQGSDIHSLSLVIDGANKMLWLSKVTQYDMTNGDPYWEVKDVLDLSNVEAGLILVPDGCSLNGAPDNEIFAASKNETIVLTWRANTTLDIFEVIPTNGIECQSDKGISLE